MKRRPLAGASILLIISLYILSTYSHETENNLNSLLSRRKRQLLQQCPSPCFQCAPALQCQNTYRQYTCNNACCCPVTVMSLTGACDGEDSVAACLNNLCGQGFFCTRKNYCCRCPTGQSIGVCVNGKCPAGYACNTNNYCCAVGMIGVFGPCINGQCPAGYVCGAGNICYSSTDGAPIQNAFNGTTNTITNAFASFPPAPSRSAKESNKPAKSIGLSSFQLAAASSEKPNFGSLRPMHNYFSTPDAYLPPSSNYENPYLQQQQNSYSGFGSSAPVQYLQQQAINQAFQSHMLNPFLFSQQQNSNPYGSSMGLGKKHKN